MWIYTGNKLAKFHGNILSLNENIAKSFRGATFLTHTVFQPRKWSENCTYCCICLLVSILPMEKRLTTNDMLELQQLKWNFVLLMSEQSILISNWLFSYHHSKFFEHVEIKLCQNVYNVDLLINALQPVLEARNHIKNVLCVSKCVSRLLRFQRCFAQPAKLATWRAYRYW